MSDFTRVGTSQGSSTSGFKFEGRGEIIDCQVVNEQTPFTDEKNPSGVKCGFAITFQPLDKDWKRTEDEPTTEFLAAGPVEKFHPGKSDGPDGDAADQGEEAEASGNCLLNGSGKEPDKRSKLYKFSANLIENGVLPGLLNGYAPNLIGLKAKFHQAPQPRGDNQKEGTADPTCLAVVKGEIYQMPNAQEGRTGEGTGAGSGSSAASAGKAKTSAKAKTNAAPAPAQTAASAPAAAQSTSAPATSGAAHAASNGAFTDDDVSARATMILGEMMPVFKGTTIDLPKLLVRYTVLAIQHRKAEPADEHIPSAMDKLIQGKFKDAEWFGNTAEAFGITVDGGKITFPA